MSLLRLFAHYLDQKEPLVRPPEVVPEPETPLFVFDLETKNRQNAGRGPEEKEDSDTQGDLRDH